MAFESSVDELLIALADSHRRRVLLALLEHDPDEGGDLRVPHDLDITTAEEERQRIQLHHVHLPHMEERGFIQWEKEPTRVTRGPRFKEIRPMLELLDEHADDLPADWL